MERQKIFFIVLVTAIFLGGTLYYQHSLKPDVANLKKVEQAEAKTAQPKYRNN